MNKITQEIKDKSVNIGALVNFLKGNPEYLEHIENNIPNEVMDRSISEKIWYFVNDIKDVQLCDCGKHLKFIGFKDGWRKTCGDGDCVKKSRRETCIEVWGVENPQKSKFIIEKTQEKIKENWNGSHFMNDDSVKKKFGHTMTTNWGVQWAQQSKEISSKSKATWDKNPNKKIIIEDRAIKIKSKTKEEKNDINNKKISSIISKFGNLENFTKYRNEKIKQNSLIKWGVDHHFKSELVSKKRIETTLERNKEKIIGKLPDSLNFIEKINNTNFTDTYIKLFCNNCQSEFSITRQFLYFRCDSLQEICLNCNPKLHGTSSKEIELFNFIQSNYKGNVVQRYKINNIEIDIYLPDLNLGFEFNGLYWHSNIFKSRLYHQNKTNKAKELGINLIHIWEDDWEYKNNIVKSIILNKLNATSEKIQARKCKLKQIDDNKLIRDFLERNHIQGFVGSKIKLGLFYEDELVSLMTFGELRKSLGSNPEKGTFELLRFCNKINTSVVGGASKLISNAIKLFNMNKIISYADFSRSNGNLYEKLQFNLMSITEPNYYYIIDDVRKHRFNFRKDKLVKLGYNKNLTEREIMDSLNINKIWDCGMLKFQRIIS